METEKENNEQRTMVGEFENIEFRRIRNRKFSVFRLLNYSPHHSSLIPDSRFQILNSKCHYPLFIAKWPQRG